MWVFPAETPSDLNSPSSSSTVSETNSSGFTDGSSQANTSLNHAQRFTMESDQHSETAELLDELISWSQYLDPCLFAAFKYEKVTDPRVLKKWLWKLCEAIFNPQNPLFLACPNDPTRFYANPISMVDEDTRTPEFSNSPA
ncbi:conserved hypothetical protein [Ricinus communis]|uniref:Uncharacterized protein n=1 Tax=Ricinus communis TaxID=3988 RepID=B9SPD2_RICCO|nr:conserved hypothetical protein [Ricinus communis]